MNEAIKPKVKKFTFFIGIDVSKNKLDFAVMQDKKFLFHREIKNDPAEIFDFVTELKKLPGFTVSKAVFCMEHTGFYCNHLMVCLKKVKANFVIDNAVHIKSTLGMIRDKSDKVDAMRIAQYAQKNRDDLRLWVPRRLVVMQLATLNTIRSRLLGVQMSLKMSLREQATFVNKKLNVISTESCQRSITALTDDLAQVNAGMLKLITDDERLRRLHEIITSVPCVGFVTSVQILISTNEFLEITNPKKFACYCGVAPFLKESGTIKSRARVSHIANKKLKSLLHFCAIGAIRTKGELKEYYINKTTIEGKPKMAVINAVRNKLILRIFACLNQDRFFEKEYIRKEEPLQQATYSISQGVEGPIEGNKSAAL